MSYYFTNSTITRKILYTKSIQYFMAVRPIDTHFIYIILHIPNAERF